MINPLISGREPSSVLKNLHNWHKFQMFLSAHYGGEELVLKLNPDEPWKKVFGPVFFYLNSVPNGTDPLSLWEDAKIQVFFIYLFIFIMNIYIFILISLISQMTKEVQSWPYSFPASENFPPPNQRGRLTGNLFVLDRYVTTQLHR